MKMRDAGVLGAALIAGTGVKIFPSLSEATKQFVAVDRVFEPNASQQERHNHGFEKYKLLYQQLVPWNAL
jgi:autoinducer-2 kinase